MYFPANISNGYSLAVWTVWLPTDILSLFGFIVYTDILTELNPVGTQTYQLMRPVERLNKCSYVLVTKINSSIVLRMSKKLY